MNKLVKIEDLLEGDEIIISGNSNLKYMKVLKTPIISKVKKYWRTGLFCIVNLTGLLVLEMNLSLLKMEKIIGNLVEVI